MFGKALEIAERSGVGKILVCLGGFPFATALALASSGKVGSIPVIFCVVVGSLTILPGVWLWSKSQKLGGLSSRQKRDINNILPKAREMIESGEYLFAREMLVGPFEELASAGIISSDADTLSVERLCVSYAQAYEADAELEPKHKIDMIENIKDRLIRINPGGLAAGTVRRIIGRLSHPPKSRLTRKPRGSVPADPNLSGVSTH